MPEEDGVVYHKYKLRKFTSSEQTKHRLEVHKLYRLPEFFSLLRKVTKQEDTDTETHHLILSLCCAKRSQFVTVQFSY